MKLGGPQQNEKPFTCAYCSERFKSMSDLIRHHKMKKDRLHKGKPVLRAVRPPANPPNNLPKRAPPPPSGPPPSIPRKKPPHRKGGRRKGVPRSGSRTYRQKLNLGKQYASLKKGEKVKWLKKKKIERWEAKRFSRIYNEYATKGTINGKSVTMNELKLTRLWKENACH